GSAGEQPHRGIAGRNSSADDEMERGPCDTFCYRSRLGNSRRVHTTANGAATVRSREKMSIRRRNRLRHLEKASVCRGGAGGSACLARARAILSHLLTVAARLQSYGFGVSYRAAISSMHHS